MLRGRVNAALISLFGLIALLRFLISARQHSESIAFIVRIREITLERFNHLRGLPGLLVFLSKTKQNTAIDGIALEHLLEDVDA